MGKCARSWFFVGRVHRETAEGVFKKKKNGEWTFARNKELIQGILTRGSVKNLEKGKDRSRKIK